MMETGGTNIFAEQMQAEAERLRQYTIYLVDDNPDDRALSLKELRKSPYVYNVQAFESGDSLMAHLVSEGFYTSRIMHQMPLLVVLDIHMPGTDGFEVLRELKEHPLTKDIPVAMVTSDKSSETAIETFKLHADACIPKPVRLASIHEVILQHHGWRDSKQTEAV